MTNILPNRHVQDDWFDKPIPENVIWGDGLYCETAQSFRQMKSKLQPAIVFGKHVGLYAGCAFSLGERGFCSVGDFSMLNGALVMASERIEIGNHVMISWNVGIADSDFHPIDAAQRRLDTIALAPFYPDAPPRPTIGSRPVKICDGAWIGFNAVILKGVTIGENAIVAAGSVVTKSVAAHTLVAGNPAVFVKQL